MLTVVAFLIALSTQTMGVLFAEEIEAKTATLPAPAVTPFTMAFGAPPDPQAERERRGSALGDHHLEGPPLPEVSPQVMAGAAPAQVPKTEVGVEDLVIIQNEVLGTSATNGITSHVLEPTVASRGQQILYTANWFAAFSNDGGSNFSYVNPSTTFPSPSGQSFCCDQIAIYDAVHDLMIWYLQYLEDGSGNTGRIAVAHGADIQAQQWRFYDFTPQGVGGWNNQWFDYPALALGDDYLYLTTNTFTTSPYSFTRAVAFRIPLDQLASYSALSYQFFDVTNAFSLRPTLGATGTMYFGSHEAYNRIRVYSWPEDSTTVSTTEVGVDLWQDNVRVAPGPDGRDWLGRADSRITGGWVADGSIGFAWTASQDSNYSFPHVRVAVLDEATLNLNGQPHLWHDHFAFAYPAMAPNGDGEIGISVAFGGGGQFHSSHAVGYRSSSPANWRLKESAFGTDGPTANKWGDYLSVLPNGSNASEWVASGYSLQGGGSSSFIQPRYIRFEISDGLIITLVNPDPSKRLKKGEQITLEAKVTQGGYPVPNRVVNFVSDDTALATVTSSATTNAAGGAQATVTGQSKYKRASVKITATADGGSDTEIVHVPDMPVLALLLMFALIVATQTVSGRVR
jgi:hypothetical protein